MEQETFKRGAPKTETKDGALHFFLEIHALVERNKGIRHDEFRSATVVQYANQVVGGPWESSGRNLEP
jgi:hypothetical protein